MRTLVLALAVMVAVTVARVSDAHAIASCYSNSGFAPAADVVLPPHPRIVYFDDQGVAPAFTATIDGAPVRLKVRAAPAGSRTGVTVIEVLSGRAGTLEVSGSHVEPVRYTIAKVRMPKRVAVAVERFSWKLRHTNSEEVFDGVALRLPSGTPAISARIRLRRDALAPWTTLIVPAATLQPKLGPAFYLGELGCSRNYSVGLLQGGVDLQMTVTLASGKTVRVTGLPAQVTLPPMPPATP